MTTFSLDLTDYQTKTKLLIVFFIFAQLVKFESMKLLVVNHIYIVCSSEHTLNLPYLDVVSKVFSSSNLRLIVGTKAA